MPAPIAVASTTSRPPALIVPPTTALPGETSTGKLSPVTELASIAEFPSTTFPSTGTIAPARTTTRSPTFTAPAGTATSRPLTSKMASLAATLMSAVNDWRAVRFDLASM